MSAVLNGLLLRGAISSIMGRAAHVSRYLARVDERLPELPNDAARRGFIGDELAKWQERYRAFAARVDAGFDPSGDVTAWDYMDTLGELDRRLARYPLPELELGAA